MKFGLNKDQKAALGNLALQASDSDANDIPLLPGQTMGQGPYAQFAPVPPLVIEPKPEGRGTAMQPMSDDASENKPFVEKSDGATSTRKEDGTCFVKLPGNDQCLVDLKSIGSLGAKAAQMLLLKNPAGLVAYSAYRFLATDDKKSDVALDVLAGSSVGAAAAVSIAREAKDALAPDTGVSGLEALDAAHLPPAAKAALVAASGAMDVGSALQNKAGPVAGLVSQAVSYGLSPLAATVGLKPESINDPEVRMNTDMIKAETIASADVTKVFSRNTPSFVEVGSFSFPNKNKTFQRDWNQETLSSYAGEPLPNLDSRIALRDFILESHDDKGVPMYFTQISMGSPDGKPYYQAQGGPYSTREDARKMANANVERILRDPVFAMLSQGFVPSGPMGKKGFETVDTVDSVMKLSPGQSLVRLAKTPEGSLRYDQITQSDDNFKILSRTYSGAGVQYTADGQVQPESFNQMLQRSPQKQGSVVMGIEDAAKEFQDGVPQPSGLSASVSSPSPQFK